MVERFILLVTNGSVHIIMTSPMPQAHHRWSAWGLSFGFHATVLATALAILPDLPLSQPSVFRMEFLLTDPNSGIGPDAPQEPPTVTQHASPPPSPPIRTTRTSTTHVSGQPSRVEPSIVQRVVSQVTTTAVAQRERNPSTTASDPVSVSSPTPIERQIETLVPITESTKPATTDTSQAVERPLMTTSSQTAANFTAEPIIKNLQHGVSHPSVASTEIPKNPAESASSLASASTDSLFSSPNDHSSSSQPTGQSSATVSQADSQTTDSSSPPSQMDSDSPPATPQQTLVMNHFPITRAIPSRPDYGWLKDLLKRRIMSLQAYPRLARMQGWEGIVVLRATIKNDGSLLDAVVTQSSGYTALDEDALALIRRACPIRLQHDLGQSHIEVFVPVHYRLE